MVNSKGQGLPLSFIVIAAISALVLIIIIAFTISGGGSLLKQIITPAPTELGTVQVACNSFCERARVTVQTQDQYKDSDYCTKTFAIDVNKNGKIEAGNETGLHCSNTTAPNVPCVVQSANGTILTC